VDEKVTKEIEQIEFHQETVASDAHSPLHLIREKEMEISGRVLSAKREADEIVAEARRDAAKLLSSAHDEAAEQSAGLEQAVLAKLEQESAELRREAERDAKALEETIAVKRPEAVEYVVKLVVSA
jgi:vacuolar-type H+-ATPase subunit H